MSKRSDSLLVLTAVAALLFVPEIVEVSRLRAEAGMRAQDAALAARRLDRHKAGKYGRLRRENAVLEARLKSRLSESDVKALVEIGGWSGSEADAMVRIAWRESRFCPRSESAVSTAYGLWQFLDSTWRATGIRKTSDPLLQTIAACRYVRARYSTPSKALAFHDRKHYY